MVLFRRSLGDVLRGLRTDQGLTLRDLSAAARVSLGYISEIERGRRKRPPSSWHRCAAPWRCLCRTSCAT